jgi:hypothetical protein
LACGEWNVEEEIRPRITKSQLERWAAFYRCEPWGDPWRREGRAVALLRSAWGIRFDKGDEERFLPTYRPGDENRLPVPQSDDEIEQALAGLPGLKKERRRRCRRSEKFAQSSRPPPPA